MAGKPAMTGYQIRNDGISKSAMADYRVCNDGD
jgi:hypothetical protein